MGLNCETAFYRPARLKGFKVGGGGSVNKPNVELHREDAAQERSELRIRTLPATACAQTDMPACFICKAVRQKASVRRVRAAQLLLLKSGPGPKRLSCFT
ncbi:hypothetical protein JOB18_016490 [Solea senegalensis]|uniref:Uncharacterized protein n=1 Tax=Solea senegalensis TaxID=28829 RepID=A0AAV6ST44_SOLSE|nr:hypothetical protein JOB18_016490 [Solea senegalensis]